MEKGQRPWELLCRQHSDQLAITECRIGFSTERARMGGNQHSRTFYEERHPASCSHRWHLLNLNISATHALSLFCSCGHCTYTFFVATDSQVFPISLCRYTSRFLRSLPSLCHNSFRYVRCNLARHLSGPFSSVRSAGIYLLRTHGVTHSYAVMHTSQFMLRQLGSTGGIVRRPLSRMSLLSLLSGGLRVKC